jgi:hypothetical protein
MVDFRNAAADETCFWLELIVEGELLLEKRVASLGDEANALTAIFTSGVRTSKLGRNRP